MSAVNHDRRESTDDGQAEEVALAAVESIEMYESDDGIVIYDSMNPLAWVQSSRAIGLVDYR